MKLLLQSIIVLTILTAVLCDHLILGNVTNKKVLLIRKVERYREIPFIKRVKSFFYADSKQRIINCIIAYDDLGSTASAQVTAGGIGYMFVNIRMKSQRGKGLMYDIGIYE